MKAPLSQFAAVRASRCEQDLVVTVIAWGDAEYALLARELTAHRLCSFFFGSAERPPASRHELPALGALLFVLHGRWEDPALSLRLDAGGQALGSALSHLEIDKEH